tara:strand:+ start:1347 stop:2555 length:1209 start_codon:yes stop_codon:yes gene_type:complete
MKTKKINIIKDSINYLKIFVPLKKDFNDYLHIGQSISNPLQVSYIKKDKIKGLKENANVVISKRPTKTERQKYFTQTTINKLLKILFDCGTNNKYLEKCDSIAYDIDKHLKINIKTEFFIEQNVAAFYSQTIQDDKCKAEDKEISFKKWDKYIFSSNGSCMNEKNFNVFKLYDIVNKQEGQKVFIVGLKQGQHVIARSLLWIKNERYFLDRIYINDNLQSSGFEEMQTKLFLAVKRTYKLNVLSCYNKTHITNYLKEKYTIVNTLINEDKIKKPSLKCLGIPNGHPSFSLLVKDSHKLIYYPYMDSFKYLREDTLTRQEEDADKILDSTCGSYTELEPEQECGDCGESYDEDEIRYSELEDDYICDDCSCYIEERDDTCYQDNAVYNSCTELYHYREDLQGY